MVDHRQRDFIMLFIATAGLACLPTLVGEFYLYLIRLILIYAIAALGLNIFMGYCGQINIGSAGFFCIGAYLPAMLQIKLGWHYGVGFPVSILVSLLVSWGMSYPLLRLRGHAMAIGTLSFAMAIHLVAERFPFLTGGADGIVVPDLALFGRTMGNVFNYYLVLVFFLVAYALCYFLTHSRIGRALMAIRDEDGAAAAMGVDINHYKTMAWIVNGVLASIAGTAYALQAGFLAPATFALWTNIIFLVMIVVGGLGSNLGSVVGSTVMTLIPYVLVTIQEYILLTQGIILFIFLRFLPEGVVGTIAKWLVQLKSREKQI